MQFHEKIFWFIWFHEFFCLDFLIFLALKNVKFYRGPCVYFSYFSLCWMCNEMWRSRDKNLWTSIQNRVCSKILLNKIVKLSFRVILKRCPFISHKFYCFIMASNKKGFYLMMISRKNQERKNSGNSKHIWTLMQ